MKNLHQTIAAHLRTWYGTLLFIFLVATDGLMIIPVSALLLFFCLENSSQSFYYAALAVATTGIGALAGYGIGLALYTTGNYLLLDYFMPPETFKLLATKFQEYQAVSSFAIALSPVPYKTLTITAGFLGVPLFPFIPLSIVARGLRFFALAAAAKYWGESLIALVDEYLYLILSAALLILTSIWFTLY